MKRLVYDIPKWHLLLHRHARGLPFAEESDESERMLEDEIFDELFSGEPELLEDSNEPTNDQEWAKELHGRCKDLPDFQRLKSETLGDEDAAALGVETIVESLKPEIDAINNQKPDNKAHESRQMRIAIRKGCREASQAVDELREAKNGMQNIVFTGGGYGGESDYSVKRSDGSKPLSLAKRLVQDERLRRIALLAGRFTRIARRKEKSKVIHGCDELTDISSGAELSRLLPSELVKIKHPLLRKVFIRNYFEKGCMQYDLVGTDSLGKGPIVCCLDKSGSMYGDEDAWATAVALALLDRAKRTKRTFALVLFNDGIISQFIVTEKDPLPAEALFIEPDGGTDISKAISHSLEIIEKDKSLLQKADVVLITDGCSDVSSAPEIRKRAKSLGVYVIGVGIGVEEETMSPWCDHAETVEDLDRLNESTANTIFANNGGNI